MNREAYEATLDVYRRMTRELRYGWLWFPEFNRVYDLSRLLVQHFYIMLSEQDYE